MSPCCSYLAKSHGNSAVFSTSGQTAGCSSTSCSCNTSLRRTVALGTSTSAAEKTCDASGCTIATLATAEKSTEKLTLLVCLLDVVLNTNTARCALVGRRCSTGAHEGSNHYRCVNGTIALSAAERGSLSAPDIAVTNDCSVRLGSAAAKALSVCGNAVQVG
jgi:hypothetical protein